VAGADRIIPDFADQNCTAKLPVHGAVFRRAKSKTIIVIFRNREQYRAIISGDAA
jgi:hypothetical protein